MNWMRHLDYRWRSFLGVDIVPEIIAALRAQAWPAEFHFQVGNLVKDILPLADAVLCRDCFVHLPFSSIENAVRLFRRAGFRFLITTTFSRRQTIMIVLPETGGLSTWLLVLFSGESHCCFCQSGSLATVTSSPINLWGFGP
jgi:hypothetical protein